MFLVRLTFAAFDFGCATLCAVAEGNAERGTKVFASSDAEERANVNAYLRMNMELD